MTIYKEFNIGGRGKSPFGSFGPLIGLIIFMVIMYFLVKGLFSILSILAPFLIIAAAVIDYTVITDFIKFILRILKENPLVGLVAILLTVVGFPAVAGYLFFKSWARKSINKKIDSIKKERERFDEYEEVKPTTSSKTVKVEDEDDFLQLPNIEQPKPEGKDINKDSEYDNLFK